MQNTADYAQNLVTNPSIRLLCDSWYQVLSTSRDASVEPNSKERKSMSAAVERTRPAHNCDNLGCVVEIDTQISQEPFENQGNL